MAPIVGNINNNSNLYLQQKMTLQSDSDYQSNLTWNLTSNYFESNTHYRNEINESNSPA